MRERERERERELEIVCVCVFRWLRDSLEACQVPWDLQIGMVSCV